MKIDDVANFILIETVLKPTGIEESISANFFSDNEINLILKLPWYFFGEKAGMRAQSMYGEGVGSESGWGLTLRPATIFRP